MQKLFVYFASLIIIFIVGAITLGEYYSAATGVLFYAAGIAVTKAIDYFLDK